MATELASLQPSVCTVNAGALPDATTFPGHELPEGAVRIWLCGAALDGVTWVDSKDGEHKPFDVVGAPEPLTGLAAQAVVSFNNLPLSDGQVKRCPGPMRYAAAVVVEYSDGDQQVLRGTGSGCDEVGGRSGWHRYFSALQGLWAEQRYFNDITLVTEVAVCPGTDSLLYPNPADAIRGYACATSTSSKDPSGQLPLPPSLVGDITTELGAHPPRLADEFPEPGDPTIVLLTKRGDPVTLIRGSADGDTAATWFWSDQQGTYAWTPSSDLAERLDAEFHQE